MRSRCRAVLLVACWLPAGAWAADCGSLSQLEWLLGDWVADGGAKSFQETWTAAGPGTFEGTGVERVKADGRIAGAESLRLVQMSGGVFYVSKVDHNELPVAFRLAACADGHFVFENLAHDFPRRLDYRRDGADALEVRVSDGGARGFTLAFRRTTASGTTAAAVLAAEDARFAAMIAADTEAMRRWMVEGLEYVHATGRVDTREQLVDGILSGHTRYLAVSPVERRVVELAPGAALVHGRGRFQVAAGDAKLDMTTRYLAAYVKEAGDWRLIGWQSLRVEPQP